MNIFINQYKILSFCISHYDKLPDNAISSSIKLKGLWKDIFPILYSEYVLDNYITEENYDSFFKNLKTYLFYKLNITFGIKLNWFNKE
jgi:hypothetical protein